MKNHNHKNQLSHAMPLKSIYLELRTDSLSLENGDTYTTFGIDIFDSVSGKYLFSISDISLSKKTVNEFIERCNRSEVSILHIRELIDDLLSEQ